jgi:D-glycero-alpha-D-manno-heptose-7-phosphate kinase
MPDPEPVRIVSSVAPIRICDNGGWTDTWFASYGKVFNIAVTPNAEVQLKVYRGDGRAPIVIHAENYGESYTPGEVNGKYDRHPLLEAALDYMKPPRDTAIEVTIFSEAPIGCSTGTSAAVTVALVAALDRLRPTHMAPYAIARAAHEIETELLKQQSGIQDQIASAFGGINLIEMYRYPHAAISPVLLEERITWELESRLVLVFVGRAHNSSDTHRMVIRELENAGPECEKLRKLRLTAERAKDALYAGDFAAFGRSLIENTCAQADLHPALVGAHHAEVIEIAQEHGALGWKVNGAGGVGGSVAILAGADRSARRAMVRAIAAAGAGYRIIPVHLSPRGVRAWESLGQN